MSEQLLSQIVAELKDLKDGQRVMRDELQVLRDEQQVIKLAVLETNESVKRLEAIQEQQHHIIELLSDRSIEQEAALKRIK